MADFGDMQLSLTDAVPLTLVWHAHNGPSDSLCARASPPAPSSDSPLVLQSISPSIAESAH